MKKVFTHKLTLGMTVAFVLALLVAPLALATVWTDKPEYSPGEVVTISGNNENSFGYLDGETIIVDVIGPNGYTAQCAAQVAGDPAITGDEYWSCQVILNSDSSASGDYSYTATRPDGSFEAGTFTDGNIKAFPRPIGTTFDLDWYIYSSIDCTGTPTSSGTENDVSNPSGFSKGVGNTESVKYVASLISDQGGAFLYWDSTEPFTELNPPTNNEICMQGFTGGGFRDYFAHYAPVEVTKTANTTFTRTYLWSIEKSADPETFDLFTGDSADTTYTIDVTQTGYVDSDWAVSGTITVNNILGAPVTVNSVADLVSGAGAATVDCPETFPYILPAGSSLVCSYTKSLPDGTNRTNTATAQVNITSGPPNPTNDTYDINGSADVIFGEPTTEVNPEVNVSDTNGGSWLFTGTDSVSYDQTFTCDDDAGANDNTATIDETGQSDDATVTVNCYALEVTKDASTTLTRTYSWMIDKSADQTDLVLAIGQSFDVNYEVEVDATSADSDWTVSGNIAVYNPAPIDATLNSVNDLVSGGILGTVDCSVVFPYTLAAGDTLNCTYTADLPDASDRTNTAVATIQNYSYDSDGDATANGTTDFTGSAAVDFGGATVDELDECVDVEDTLEGVLGTVCAGVDTLPKTFSYANPVGPYAVAGDYTVDNTASFVTNDTGTTGSDSWTVNITVLPNNSFSRVTSSSLCVFDRNGDVTGQQFNLLYTQDPKSPNTYKLTASNPGQFYYNVFYAVSGPTTLDISIPFPFVTQGATPVHIYDGLEEYTDESTGETCYIPGEEIDHLQETINLSSSPHTYSIDVDSTTSGMVYVAIHLDYGLKGTVGYLKDTPAAGGASNGTYSIPNNQPYSFSFDDDGSAPAVDSQTVYSQNIFKKNPGVAGMSLSSLNGDPKAGVKVQIYDSKGKLLATVYSDQDGFYQWIYKYTGKPATFVIKLPAYGQSQSVTLKSNGFLEVNFNNLP